MKVNKGSMKVIINEFIAGKPICYTDKNNKKLVAIYKNFELYIFE